MPVKFEYAVQESLTNMRRNLFMSFAAVMVVAVALLLTGGVLLLRNSLSRSAALFTGKVEVAVFLAPEVSSDERDQVQRDLLQMPEVAKVIYESQEQAYERFKQLFADEPDIVANTSKDALPESFRIKLKDPEKFVVIRDRFEGRPGILAIRDERQTLKSIFAATREVRKVAAVIAIVVGLAAMVLIATTIRMAIYARRKEIEIMKLVGATNWFVRVPFMFEGMVQGLIGAAVAVSLLFATKPFISSVGQQNLTNFPNLGFQITYGDIAVHGVYLALAGILVGAVGSMVGLRRFLDV